MTASRPHMHRKCSSLHRLEFVLEGQSVHKPVMRTCCVSAQRCRCTVDSCLYLELQQSLYRQSPQVSRTCSGRGLLLAADCLVHLERRGPAASRIASTPISLGSLLPSSPEIPIPPDRRQPVGRQAVSELVYSLLYFTPMTDYKAWARPIYAPRPEPRADGV